MYKKAPVVEKVDNVINWINHLSTEYTIGLPGTYPLDSEQSGPEHIILLNGFLLKNERY